MSVWNIVSPDSSFSPSASSSLLPVCRPVLSSSHNIAQGSCPLPNILSFPFCPFRHPFSITSLIFPSSLFCLSFSLFIARSRHTANTYPISILQHPSPPSRFLCYFRLFPSEHVLAGLCPLQSRLPQQRATSRRPSFAAYAAGEGKVLPSLSRPSVTFHHGVPHHTSPGLFAVPRANIPTQWRCHRHTRPPMSRVDRCRPTRSKYVASERSEEGK